MTPSGYISKRAIPSALREEKSKECRSVRPQTNHTAFAISKRAVMPVWAMAMVVEEVGTGRIHGIFRK